MSGEGDFWSRRKAAVAAEQEAETAAEEAAALEEQTAALEEKSEAEVLEELGLPDPDTLGKGDDFSVFMKGPVPQAIRRRALRRLWRTNPVLANLDNLVEYGEDYTKTNVGAEGLKSAYEVGRGFWKRFAEEAEAAKAEAAEDPEAAAEEGPTTLVVEEEAEEAAPPPPPEEAPDFGMSKNTADQSVEGVDQPQIEDHAYLTRRRMKFRF